ncbi:MAG: hypothetical protein F6K40_02630 [Okeania sp. SIO3I5]|uniref:hypothetical protein n=1 Tax=Okeania sp. SIO3I5 TaxID=2607805 RepID=UPI0013BE2E89|nr:hypothetical protein [Okeania sp. SIO3I5]NEQ35258.1 hypothetical protein [Okeania sp. SIO3I5]
MAKQSVESYPTPTPIDIGKLNAFLKKNEEIDFRTADLLHTSNIEKYKWPKLKKDEKESLVKQLKAYQRMLRVVPPGRDDLAKALLKNGIQSSLQIASTPKKVFIQKNLELFNNERTLAEQVYLRALALRKAVTLQYMARVQQLEPHTRAAGLQR